MNKKNKRILGVVLAAICIIVLICLAAYFIGRQDKTPSVVDDIPSYTNTEPSVTEDSKPTEAEKIEESTTPEPIISLEAPVEEVIVTEEPTTGVPTTVAPTTEQKLNGYHVQAYDNGDKYEGNFVNGVRQGQGTYTWENGIVYIGEFVNGEPSGSGSYVYPTTEPPPTTTPPPTQPPTITPPPVKTPYMAVAMGKYYNENLQAIGFTNDIVEASSKRDIKGEDCIDIYANHPSGISEILYTINGGETQKLNIDVLREDESHGELKFRNVGNVELKVWAIAKDGTMTSTYTYTFNVVSWDCAIQVRITAIKNSDTYISTGEFFKQFCLVSNLMDDRGDDYKFYGSYLQDAVGLSDEFLTDEGLKAPITRVEIANILSWMNYINLFRPSEERHFDSINNSITDYSDLAELDRKCITYCVKYNLMDITDGKFRPFEGVTFEEAREYIYRINN